MTERGVICAIARWGIRNTEQSIAKQPYLRIGHRYGRRCNLAVGEDEPAAVTMAARIKGPKATFAASRPESPADAAF